MSKLKRAFLTYVLTDRKIPEKNREHVGQNLMILTIFLFFVFMVNFMVIIGTDSKFGVDLSDGAASVHQKTYHVQAKRGTIYDRNGDVIAEDSTTYSVYAIIDKTYVSTDGKKLYVQPSQYDTVAKIFKQKLGIKPSYTKKQLKMKNLSQISFGSKGNNITYSKMTEITKAMKKAGVPGISFAKSPGRMYPNGIFASEMIGIVSTEEDKSGIRKTSGISGLERAMDSILAGVDGEATYQKDRQGNVLLGTETIIKEAIDGSDVYTTLSAPLQLYLETQLDVFQSKLQAKQVSASVVNAKTGEILAVSQRPTYDADTKEGITDDDYHWNNLLYETNYEPGSTMKVMLLAAAINEGVFNTHETYFNDELTIADATIRDWDVNTGVASGRILNFPQAFAYSSNIGMVLLEQKMGDAKWLNYLDRYRFGVRTRFGMYNETPGVLPEKNVVSTAMSTFGQGIGVSRVQMLRAFTAISNDGQMLEPQLISKIYDPNTKTSRTSQKEIVGHPVSASAAKKTRDYMVTVGTDPYYGTLYYGGPIIKVNNESVAVKSGTAEIADEGGVGYLTGSNDLIHSVVAMVPAENPQFIMYVTAQQPKNTWSGLLWQDLVNPVLEEAMSIKGTLTSPKATPKSEQTGYALPKLVGKHSGETAAELRRHLVHPILLGTGEKIKKISLAEGTNVPENTQVLILTDQFKAIPDMYGWTKKNVKLFEKWTGINVVFKGKKSGRVIKQSVEMGTDLNKVKKITITLGG